jgi:hypothetical protein
MASWAVTDQGFAKSKVRLITDEKKPVRARQLQDAINELLSGNDVEQLIVYFAGHGVNIGGSEFWLLSDAPGLTSEAVNLNGTADLAFRGTVSHVVFISDACRTAAEGIHAQAVKGVEIFPNKEVLGVTQSVDKFFATSLGSPAFEIKDPRASARRFKAVYTETVLSVLEGRHIEALETREEGEIILAFVRPRGLMDYLASAVPAKLKGVKGLKGSVIQQPVAILTSREKDAWIARFVERGPARTSGTKSPLRARASVRVLESVHTVARIAVRSALTGDATSVEPKLAQAARENISGVSMLAQSVRHVAKVVGPTQFESRCGFKVRGNRLVAAIIRRPARAHVFPNTRQEIIVSNLSGPAASVLLEFENGVGLVVPAIRDFVGELTFEKGDLIAVSYEPSDNSKRWHGYGPSAEQFRTLRAIAVSAGRLGAFRLEGEDAPQLALMFQRAKNVDPVMALYAAYSYHSMHLEGALHDMHHVVCKDLKMRLFDLAMLTGSLNGTVVDRAEKVFPAFPMMAQGWPLLSARRISLSPCLDEVRSHLIPSLWSVFDGEGTAILRSAIHSGAMR